MRLVRSVVLLALAFGACSKEHAHEREDEQEDSGAPDDDEPDAASETRPRDASGPRRDAEEAPTEPDAALAANDAAITRDASLPRADAAVCMPRVISGRQDLAEALIVFDRSLSMALFGRWEPTRSALKASVEEFQHRVAFGLAFFPGSGMTCGGAEKLDVALATGSSAAIAAALDAAQPDGFTPTGAALRTALSILGQRTPAAGVTPKPGVVLLLTDGEPSCGSATGVPDTLQIDAANAASAALNAAGIPSYVIGYQIDAAQKSVMDGLAQRGGTDHYRPVNNAIELSAVLREITQGLGNPCRYTLTARAAFDYLQAELDGVALARDAQNGWELVGESVMFRGAACALLNDGKPHHVSVREGC